MRFNDRITELRRNAGLTQEQLAKELFVSRELVSKWERGERLPDYKTVGRLAQALGTAPEQIISEDELIRAELAECIPAGQEGRNADVVPLLNRFLGDLKQKPRNVFVRRYRFHESPKEIGELYGIGEGYVRTMLARTRRKLKAFLKESVSDEQ
jgi:transcriptional regulator with XRE-family HTH domain